MLLTLTASTLATVVRLTAATVVDYVGRDDVGGSDDGTSCKGCAVLMMVVAYQVREPHGP